MKVFLNYKTSSCRETIDELNSDDFENMQQFKQEKRNLLHNYEIAFHVYRFGKLYWSSRCCSNWKNK